MELLTYDKDSGLFVRRITNSSRAIAGNVAGGKRPDGYRTINIDGKRYLIHRLVWFYFHGKWPKHHLDHINMDRGDSRIENLREATKAENGWNVRCRSHSNTGLKGVTRNGRRWQAQIRVNKERIYLGTYDSPDEAHTAYVNAANKMHGEFARLS